MCQTLPVVGATCTTAVECGRDLACAVPANATTGTCAARVASGGACLTNVNPCASGLSCVGDVVATSTPGMCKPAAATVGAACDGSRKTMASCDPELGLACIPTAAGSAVGTCQNAVLVAGGATCGTIGTPVTMVAECQAGGLCKKALATDKTGTCVAAAADGAACDSDPSKGPPCLAPAKCVPSGAGTAGVCTLPNAAMCH
jgi:hypothetical protein